MLWIYVLLTTVGVVAIVPTILRAIDGMPSELLTGFAGFVGLFGGLTGLFCRQAGIGGWATFIAAAAIGLAAGALHPELLAKLRGDEAPSATGGSFAAAASRTSKKKPALTHDDT